MDVVSLVLRESGFPVEIIELIKYHHDEQIVDIYIERYGPYMAQSLGKYISKFYELTQLIDIVKHLHRFTYDVNAMNMAVGHRFIWMLKWMRHNHPEIPCTSQVLGTACARGVLEVLICLRKLYKWQQSYGMNAALKNGHAHILDYLQRKEVPTDYEKSTFVESAIASKKISMLDWLKNNGYRNLFDSNTINRLAAEGNITMLIWFKRNLPDIVCLEEAYLFAIDGEKNRIGTIIWLRKNYPDTPITMNVMVAAEYASTQVSEWVKSNLRVSGE
jgi:hypothetical protein